MSNQHTIGRYSPRTTVSWYQAIVFTRWLNHALRGSPVRTRRAVSSESALSLSAAGDSSELIVGETAEIRLPTEWEWQWLAQNGREGRAYAWGAWRDGLANTAEVGLSRTTAVGMYPNGQAECGALDVAGNLFEWCLNDYYSLEIVNGYTNGSSKVLRGGSFSDNQYWAASSYRYSDNPGIGSRRYGWRVVCAPLIASLPSDQSEL